MKSLRTIQTLSRIGMILSKIVYIFCIIGAVGCVIGMICLSFAEAGVLLCLGFILLNGRKLGFAGYMTIFGVATIALCVLLRFRLRGNGCRRFVAL